MTLLALETSCDETSAAVVRGGRILSNVVSSQIKLHAEYGGVVPELAAREHLKNLLPVAQEALREAGVLADQLDAVAATYAGRRAVVRIGADTVAGWTPSESPTLLLVDDTTKATPAHPWLGDPALAEALAAGGHVIVAAFDQAELTTLGFSHWLTRRPCSGLLLALDATADRIVAGERVGFQPPAELRAGPVGRGWWCERGVGTPVQVATV